MGRGVVTPDMSSEDPALQPPVLELWWDGDGEGHPHPGMLETDRSVTQSRRNASSPILGYARKKITIQVTL